MDRSHDLRSAAARRPAAHPYWARAHTKAATAFKTLSDATLRSVPAERLLELANDPSEVVYFVLNGWLVVSKSTHDGHRQIIDFVLPGETFDPAAADAIKAATDVATLTDATLSLIPRRDWRALLTDHADLQETNRRRRAGSYARIAERLLRLGHSKADGRIAYAICELCLRSSDLGLVDGSDFHLPLTQQVLGDFVGLSHVHVSRTFRRLKAWGVLDTADHMDILIHDVARLAAIAEIDIADLRKEILNQP